MPKLTEPSLKQWRVPILALGWTILCFQWACMVCSEPIPKPEPENKSYLYIEPGPAPQTFTLPDVTGTLPPGIVIDPPPFCEITTRGHMSNVCYQGKI